jgi:hypothetical protein
MEEDDDIYVPFIYNILDSIFYQNESITDILLEEARMESMETFQNELFRRDRSLSIDETECKRRRFNSTKHRNSKCFICMEDYKDKEMVLQLQCGHVHHPNCIKTAIQYNATCPICKIPIKTNGSTSQLADDISGISSSFP